MNKYSVAEKTLVHIEKRSGYKQIGGNIKIKAYKNTQKDTERYKQIVAHGIKWKIKQR